MRPAVDVDDEFFERLLRVFGDDRSQLTGALVRGDVPDQADVDAIPCI